MKNYLILVALALCASLSACAQTVWQDATGNGRGAPDLQVDSTDCSQSAQATTPDDTSSCDKPDAAGQTGCLIGAALADGLMQAMKFNACMQSRGWQQVKVAQTAQSPGYEQAAKEAKAAIDECKAKRLAGEIEGFVASAECSNPSLIEAYQKAGFTNMDLIERTADKRMEVAERIDAKEITEEEGNREIADFIKSASEGTVAYAEAKGGDDDDEDDSDDDTQDVMLDTIIAQAGVFMQIGDYAAALQSYRLAAEQGDERAENALGVMYAKGWGVPKNPEKALHWFRRAERDAGDDFSKRRAIHANMVQVRSGKDVAVPQKLRYIGEAQHVHRVTPGHTTPTKKREVHKTNGGSGQ